MSYDIILNADTWMLALSQPLQVLRGKTHMDVVISGNMKERVIVVPSEMGTKEMHFYASREDFLRMLKEYGGAEYQYLASIRALLYVEWENVFVDAIYGIPVKPVGWHDWDKSIVISFYVANRVNVQYMIFPKDYEAWKTIRRLLMKLDREGIQEFPPELENL